MKYITFVTVLVVVEIVLAFVFTFISAFFYKKTNGFDKQSIFKGVLERFFLFFTLYNDFPHALTFFSAVKLATRLKHEEVNAEDANKFNNFYLVGNLLSVIFSVLYILLAKFLYI